MLKKITFIYFLQHTGCARLNGKNSPESKLHPEQGRVHVLEQNLFNKYFQVQYTESIFQKSSTPGS
jgi:hypothetical protein